MFYRMNDMRHCRQRCQQVKTLRLPHRKECNMNRWLITPSVLAVALAASAPPDADTQGRGEGVIVISDNVPIYNWGQSAAASTDVQTKAVYLGQTIEQVDQIIGAP